MVVATKAKSGLSENEVSQAFFEMLVNTGQYRTALKFAVMQDLGNEYVARATNLVYESLMESEQYEEAADWAMLKKLGDEKATIASNMAVEHLIAAGNFTYGRTVAKERGLSKAQVVAIAKKVCLGDLKRNHQKSADKTAAEFGFSDKMEPLAREAVVHYLGGKYSFDNAAELAIRYLPKEEVKGIVREVIKREIGCFSKKEEIVGMARKAGILKEVKGIAQQYYDGHFPDEAVFLAEIAKDYLTVEEMRRAGKLILQGILCNPDSKPDEVKSAIDEYSLRENEEIRPAALVAYVFYEGKRNYKQMARAAKTFRLGGVKLNSAVKSLVEELLKEAFSPLESAYEAAKKYGGKEGIAIVRKAIEDAFADHMAKKSYLVALSIAEKFPNILVGQAKPVAEKYFDSCMEKRDFSGAIETAEEHLGSDKVKMAAEAKAMEHLLRMSEETHISDISHAITGFYGIVRENNLDPAFLRIADQVQDLVREAKRAS